jgi:Protein of unknown function (DUF4232)
MHRLVFFPRRLIGAAAIACAAAMIPVAALAATSTPAAGRAATPACRTSGLVIWLTPQFGGGYAGGYYYNLNFTNQSGHACTLGGYPGVSAVSRSGRQLGSPAGWGAPGNPVVTLPNGYTATSLLRVEDARAYGCRATAAGLRVYPPNQFTAKVISYRLSACARRGPVWMGAGPVRRG